MSKKERLEEGWIHCSIIVEILGKPKEYIGKVIKEVADRIGETKGIEVLDKKFHEPSDASNGLFSTFTEIELMVKDMMALAELVFSYMPSNIEILAPQELKMKLNDTNLFINWLAERLHGYDSIAKKLKIENMVLKKKLQDLGELPKEVKDADEIESVKTGKITKKNAK